jgi:hypothetical protein
LSPYRQNRIREILTIFKNTRKGRHTRYNPHE